MSDERTTRRRYLRTTGAALAVGAGGVLAGCSNDGEGDVPGADVTVSAGPGGSLVFEPERVTVSTGETVGWSFDSAGHNVSAVPDHSDEVSIPDGAEPFASYGDGGKFETSPTGETYSHTFETAGEYTYVCVPHVASGMIGTVVVE